MWREFSRAVLPISMNEATRIGWNIAAPYITMNSTPEHILLAREQRVLKQQQLIETYRCSLLCMRVNYPGVHKNNNVSIGIFNVLAYELYTSFQNDLQYCNVEITAEGPILTAVIGLAAEHIKAMAVQMEENHALGRFVDIDTYSSSGTGIRRQQLGFKGRSCYLCPEPAHCCVRQARHGMEEIKEHIRLQYEHFLASTIANHTTE